MGGKQISIQQLTLLFRYVLAKKGSDRSVAAFKALIQELPSFTDGDIVCLLMNSLKEPSEVSTALCCLAEVDIPADTDLEPLKKIVRGKYSPDRLLALDAFRKVQEGAGEAFLLEVLRRTQFLMDIDAICDVLGDIGTWQSFPVLMARLDDAKPSINRKIYDTIGLIGKRAAIPESEMAEIKKPSSWKMKWEGPAKNFTSMVDIFAMMSGIAPDDTEKIDLLAEAYLDAMEVDISPYQTYRELRLCTSADNSPVDMLTQMLDHTESMFFLEKALSGTGVSYSEETQFENINGDMQIDYFITRLRRRIKFPDDDY
jgi:hypothetical protein